MAIIRAKTFTSKLLHLGWLSSLHRVLQDRHSPCREHVEQHRREIGGLQRRTGGILGYAVNIPR